MYGVVGLVSPEQSLRKNLNVSDLHWGIQFQGTESKARDGVKMVQKGCFQSEPQLHKKTWLVAPRAPEMS